MGRSGPHYRLSPRAEDDLQNIYGYTAETWSPPQAMRYHSMIVAALDDIADRPAKGRAIDIRPGYMKYAVGSHVIFYRIADDGIDVIRILHRRMDAETNL
ncbi:MAG: type II toxin-antitoxin system RelE/ParE family toxin [Bauldia sp.]